MTPSAAFKCRRSVMLRIAERRRDRKLGKHRRIPLQHVGDVRFPWRTAVPGRAIETALAHRGLLLEKTGNETDGWRPRILEPRCRVGFSRVEARRRAPTTTFRLCRRILLLVHRRGVRAQPMSLRTEAVSGETHASLTRFFEASRRRGIEGVHTGRFGLGRPGRTVIRPRKRFVDVPGVEPVWAGEGTSWMRRSFTKKNNIVELSRQWRPAI